MDPLENSNNTTSAHLAMDHAETKDVNSTEQAPITSKTDNANIVRSPEKSEGDGNDDQVTNTSSTETTGTMISPDATTGQSVTDDFSIAKDDSTSIQLTELEIISQVLDNPNLAAGPRAMVESHLDPEGASLHYLAVDEPHPDTDKIIRQVEFYLGDENLPNDAHLLSFTGEKGDGWVSINRIFGFAKMRGYKPKAKAKEALRGSTFLEVDEKLKFVRRMTPLSVSPRVKPRQSEENRVAQTLINKPWLSKAMLKPTGFEEGFTEGPLRPEEHEADRKLYDPDEAFTIRIDYAVAKYMSKRKMHQDTLNVFSKFLTFGGFDGTAKQFTGGFDEKDLENYSKDEIMQMKASFAVSEVVYDGLDEEQEGGASWVVDFEGMAKAFFSSHLLQHFDWKDAKVTDNATNVINNFFNYLQYHQVCPEYTEDLLNARKVCNIAQQELPKLAIVARSLPGDFNTACSTMFGGYYAMRRPFNPHAEWVNPDDDVGLSDVNASAIWHAALVAHCSNEHYKQFRQADEDGSLTVVEGHQTGLEVIEVQFASEQVKKFYQSAGLTNTVIRPTGKLICKRWVVPGASRLDIPQEIIDSREAKMPKQYEFYVEEEVLRSCYPGLKLEANVMEFNVGDISYIDCVHFVYPSFFTWTLNERIHDYTSSGPPTEWMKRQNELHSSGEGSEGGEADAGCPEGGEADGSGSDGDGVKAIEHAKGDAEGIVGDREEVVTADG